MPPPNQIKSIGFVIQNKFLARMAQNILEVTFKYARLIEPTLHAQKPKPLAPKSSPRQMRR